MLDQGQKTPGAQNVAGSAKGIVTRMGGDTPAWLRAAGIEPGPEGIRPAVLDLAIRATFFVAVVFASYNLGAAAGFVEGAQFAEATEGARAQAGGGTRAFGVPLGNTGTTTVEGATR